MESKTKNENFTKTVILSLKFLFSISFLLFVFYIILIIRGDYPDLQKKLQNFPILSNIITERNKVVRKSSIKSLNDYIPSFDYLVSFMNNPSKKFDEDKITGYGGYFLYYKKVAEFMPSNANIQGMLGFCYYHLGEYKKSLSYYKKAIDLNPYYFWFKYNAGIISLKTENYEEARKFLQQALIANKDITLKVITMSRTYRQIIAGSTNIITFSPEKRLEKGYKRCLLLLSIINKNLNNNEQIPTISDLNIYVF